MARPSAVARNAVKVTGTGPPILLVHGFGCDQTMWGLLTPHLQPGHTVIAYDLTGMGASDYTAYDRDRHASLKGHAQDLLEILDELDADPVVAIGHSVSAIIVALAAIEAPQRFARLVMLGPNPHYLDDPPYHGGFDRPTIDGLLATMDENYQGWAGSLASLVAGSDAEANATLEARFCRNDPEISKHFAAVTFLGDNRRDLGHISTPTLVIHCVEDAITPAHVAQFVTDAIPDATLVTLPAEGHAPHMTHPEETAQAIRRFLPWTTPT